MIRVLGAVIDTSLLFDNAFETEKQKRPYSVVSNVSSFDLLCAKRLRFVVPSGLKISSECPEALEVRSI